MDNAFTEIPEGFHSGFCVLWGRPNVGKSTLLNALLARKVAIVSPKPQTTRNRIAGVWNAPDSQVVFQDTPGIHEPRHRLGECLVDTAKSALPDAEVVLFIADGSCDPTEEDLLGVSLLKDTASPVILAVNKADLITSDQLEVRIESYRRLRDFTACIAVSALEGTHLDQLKALIVERLPEGPPYFPPEMVTDHPETFMVAEFVREAVLNLTHQEIPHSVAVVVEEMEPRPNNVTYIPATVFVERDSQKGIVIGDKGKMLRQIGQQAREHIEELLGCKVFLELHVKVKEKWRRDESSLQRFGYLESRHDRE